MEHFQLWAPDGAPLFARRWTAAGTGRAVVRIVHGLGEHSGRYAALAGTLCAAGYHVYMLDNRGHGINAGNADRLGRLRPGEGWWHWVADVHQLGTRARRDHPGLPHILIGHSLGSMIAQDYAVEHGETLDGLVLSGTDNRPGPMPWLGYGLGRAVRLIRGGEYRSALLYWLGIGAIKHSIPDRRTDADWLSRDPAVVDAYLRDPLCGFRPSVAMWLAIARGVIRISGRRRGRIPPDLPVLLLVGTADPLSAGGRRVTALSEVYRRRGVASVQLIRYQGARHEVFNDSGRDAVLRDLHHWLERVLAGGGQPELAPGAVEEPQPRTA